MRPWKTSWPPSYAIASPARRVGANVPRIEELPDLPPLTPFLLAALILTFWLAMRIDILRRQQARRDPGEPPVPAWGWLETLAAKTWILPALVLAAALLALAVAATFLLR